MNKNNLSKKQFLTKSIVEKLCESDDYYSLDRWNHYGEILKYVKEMDNLNNVLEIGPYKTPLVSGCDIMDIRFYLNDYPFEINECIKHDCSKTPFPIEDKKYDLIIASQVLEHLGYYGQQKDVFNEIERISHKAVITLPFDWNVPNFRSHHRIDRRVFDNWAEWRKYDVEEITGEEPYKRILRIYTFDK